MFKKFFTKKTSQETKETAPEIMGLRLGGAFELDPLKLRLIEPDLIIQGAASTHLIQAVGVLRLDDASYVLRYYSDDDAFIQVLLEGGMSENNISDVKLWYFYDTQSVSSEAQWNDILEHSVSQSSIELEGYTFHPVWENAAGEKARPVAMTETTYSATAKKSQTDQFCMLYEREAKAELYEYAMFCAEEKIIDNRADRCLVKMTGFDLQPADLQIIG